MQNAPAILRSLVVYAICVLLAVIAGFMLTDPLNYSTFAYAGILGLVLASPLLLRWHYVLLLFSLNCSIYLSVLPGRPEFWIVMVMLSLGISVLERIMNSQKRFIYVPQISWPLFCMLGVIYMTAKLTGGMGLHSFGGDVGGGRKYILVIVGSLAYFAVTARRIPPERAGFFIGVFMLSGLTRCIGELYPITPSFLHFIFWVFPPSGAASAASETGITRLGGLGFAATGLLYWLLATKGLRGIFLSNKIWRKVLFVGLVAVGLLGGFRINLLAMTLIVGTLFIMEKMYLTRVMPVFVLAGILGTALIIPLASHLPFAMQRALTILPLPLSPEARMSTEGSSQWRIDMWKALVPQIPKYLLVGKGYALTKEDFEIMGRDSAFHSVDASQQGLAISGDYHNGPLSVIIPFGIWGAIAFLWFIIAVGRVLYCNYRYGDESLRTFNTYYWATYMVNIPLFMFVYGGLTEAMVGLGSTVGFSLALNGGVCRPVLQPVQTRRPPMVHPSKILPRARPAFQR